MEISADLKPAYIDPEGIHNCLLNLVSNAIDACTNRPGGAGKVVIRSVRETLWAVVYQVQENSLGMDKGISPKVFRPFFSTKGRRGTRLGLMVTRKIVLEHGAAIDFESEKGKGTIFTIRLPRLKETQDAESHEAGPEGNGR